MKSCAKVLELREGEPARIRAGSISDRQLQALLRLTWLDVVPLFDAGSLAYDMRATNVCGQTFLDDDLLVRVTPKVPVGNLFGMLELVYQLKSFQIHDGLVDIDSLSDLYERLALLLARRIIDRARRGLFREYVDEDATLGYVRGRIDLRASSRLLAAGSAAVHCEYQDHTADILDNQILAWTLDRLARASLQRDDVRLQVRRARRVLVGAVGLRPIGLADCKRRTYSRLNEDYRLLHGLCRFFLESLGPGIERGDHEVMPYTVNMAQLFESYVAEWLKAHGPANMRFSVQHALRLVGSTAIEWNVDILARDRETDAPVAVLDTKYKLANTPSAADIQQVVSYAVEVGVNRAFVVYPTKDIAPFRVQVGNVLVQSVCFDLGSDLEQGAKVFLSQCGWQ